MESKMKIISMYLPQFHRVKENDEWWGEGFTDWVTAKNAKPLYDNHYQPHIPLNNNYYDLSEKKTMEWQAELMHKYGIDGMCMYHYWFKDGRRILEKPAENLLQWKDINMPFCFCWANETWARSWSNVKGANVWSNLHEKNVGQDERGILLEQNYGKEEAWKNHFEYLLPFFEDDRYIRQDGKPVFVMYKPNDIICIDEMVQYWQALAVEAGLKGLYIIGRNCNSNLSHVFDAELCHEPALGLRNLLGFKSDSGVFRVGYDEVWERVLNSRSEYKKVHFGGFVGYDDSPRRGNCGTIIENSNPNKFEYYLTELIAKNVAHKSELVFINAWNEWGEGMHLEPDEKYGLAFLEAINKAKENYEHRVSYYMYHNNVLLDDFHMERKKADKFERYLNTLDIWMELREKNIRIASFFQEKNSID